MSRTARFLAVLAVVAACLCVTARAVIVAYPNAALAGVTDYRLSNNADNPYPSISTSSGPQGSLYTSATLTDGVFTIQGADAVYSSDARPAAQVQVVGLKVSNGNVIITGYFPRDTLLQLTTITGTVAANTPFLDMSRLSSGNEVVVEVADATVAWAAAETTANTQVLLRIPTATNSNSAVFALDAALTRASAVVSAATTATSVSMMVSNYAVVAADYITCTGCNNGIIYVDTVPVYVQSGGMIRASHIRITSDVTPAIILNTPSSSVTASSGGLLVIENVSAQTVNLFSGGAAANEAGGFVLRYLDVNAIGATLGATTTYADVKLGSSAAASELSAATAVTTGCPVACLNSGFLASPAQSCACTCPAGSGSGSAAASPYYQNFCTTMTDPLASFVPTGCMDGCDLCHNETACTTCATGFIPNTATGVCEQTPATCPTNCKTCSAAGLCTACNDGYAVSNSGACVRCTVANCLTCSATNPGVCTTCVGGSAPVNNVCTLSCTDPHCVSCPTAPGTCGRCADHYGLVNGVCTPCADPNCRQCNGDANTCTACDAGYIVQGTGCSASSDSCDVTDCLVCDPADVNKCKTCIDGKIVDSVTGQCITSGSCSVANCAKCSATSASICETCNTDYTPSADGTSCSLTTTTTTSKAPATTTTTSSAPSTCTVPHCTTCVSGNPNACQFCNDDYYSSNGQCVLAGSCYVGKCAQCMLRDSTKCSNCISGYLISSTYTCISQHVNANGAAAPQSLWVAAAVLLASAVTYLA